MATAVVLAAGEGARLSGAKALARLGGSTFLERAIATCAASLVDEAVVVAGAQADEVAAEAERVAARTPGFPVRVALHAAWRAGRTSSVQAGWSAAGPNAHVVLYPVDHPLVRIVTVDLLLGAFGYAAATPEVVVPVTLDGPLRRRGHPIVLAAAMRPRVLALGPDEPLHDLVRAATVLEVPVDDEGIHLDVDTPEDLARAESLLAEREA